MPQAIRTHHPPVADLRNPTLGSCFLATGPAGTATANTFICVLLTATAAARIVSVVLGSCSFLGGVSGDVFGIATPLP